MRFHGAKIALLRQGELIVILRDDIPDINWPGHWDFPGGGSEDGETPLACAMRELEEELGLQLDPSQVVWKLQTLNSNGLPVWFFVAHWDDLDLATIRLGDEGQRWDRMSIPDYLAHELAIPSLVRRLGLWLNETGATG